MAPRGARYTTALRGAMPLRVVSTDGLGVPAKDEWQAAILLLDGRLTRRCVFHLGRSNCCFGGRLSGGNLLGRQEEVLV